MTQAARGHGAPLPPLDALSVVIPVYNEETWIRTCVTALMASGQEADLLLDVVVVDDGSTDRTPEVLRELAAEHDIRVVTQANAGRLAARTAGCAAAREPWLLLLDSRVIIDRTALSWVRRTIAEHPDRLVWCGHVDVETEGNPYAAFWSGLVKIGWRRYTSDPRLVSFGAEEFDAYPKGTTGLLIPAAFLDEAVRDFESLFDDENLSSDDTRLLRDVAGRTNIWLSPDFRFRYHGKQGARGFLRQSYFRGTTFVDGYLGQPGPVRRALLAALGAGGVVAAASLRRPAVAVLGLGTVSVAAPVVVSAVGGSRDEVRSAALLAPVFSLTFGAGVLRGLALAAVRLGRRGRGAPQG
ncbi:glycosyltransferase family 2 protein [Modestobacter sp. VKM Ac-2983]|uniref:glycosyltransferase family 2 protein n=1 Tax=Modestobacter sp. VKM Ac-2983 TaxID=3004137 RepID=UPI0022ABC185|nr:glycosyltransferase family 2 protein [Modestobacter sp. VKM Ac-2983]MCZ2806487.1 glycosyltransferase family 2 protein [Modestobacter sp. VKM Ac-2983]